MAFAYEIKEAVRTNNFNQFNSVFREFAEHRPISEAIGILALILFQRNDFQTKQYVYDVVIYCLSRDST